MESEERREIENEELDWEAREALEDPDGPQACDLEGQSDEDETETAPCPKCGREIAEDADQCPGCGEWVVRGGESGGGGHGVVIMIVGVLVLLGLVYFLL